MRTLASLAVVVGAGFLVGLALTYWMLRRSALARAQAGFETWRAVDLRRVRRETLDLGRALVKARVGDALAGDTPALPFVAADARFLGHPVHYVVFDGHTEVKDRSAASLREVVFVSLVPRSCSPSPFIELVRECVAAGRVEWMTLSLPSAAPASGAGQ